VQRPDRHWCTKRERMTRPHLRSALYMARRVAVGLHIGVLGRSAFKNKSGVAMVADLTAILIS
jgi:hypothetical protein